MIKIENGSRRNGSQRIPLPKENRGVGSYTDESHVIWERSTILDIINKIRYNQLTLVDEKPRKSDT